MVCWGGERASRWEGELRAGPGVPGGWRALKSSPHRVKSAHGVWHGAPWPLLGVLGSVAQRWTREG